MTEQSNTTMNDANKGFVAQTQERVTGAATGLVDSIKANPKTAAAVAVGAAAAVAGVAYRDKITEAVGASTSSKTATKAEGKKD